MFLLLLNFLKILIIVVPLLIAVAYFTLAERKILGAIQRRRGPNVVGTFGLLQPLSDGLKLMLKETVIPSNCNKFIFIISPIITFSISLLGWAVIPFGKYSVLSDMNLGVLYLLAISSLGVYGIIMSGWSSNSKYAFLGALRSAAQMVSYEVSIGFILLTIIVCVGSFNLGQIIIAQKYVWFITPFFPLFLMFFISALAETNRHPFDLPEAEAELVSGYNVEYSAMGFALFSLGEYANMLIMCSCTVIFFLGGWMPLFSVDNLPDIILSIGSFMGQNTGISFLLSALMSSDTLAFFEIPGYIWFSLKIVLIVMLYVWMRAALPRYRYDQLMDIGWKVFLPLSITYLILTFYILITFNILPN